MTTTQDVLVTQPEASRTDRARGEALIFIGSGVAALPLLLSFSGYMQGSFYWLPIAASIVGVATLIYGMCIYLDGAIEAEDLAIRKDTDRQHVRTARLSFLSERGVEMVPDEVDRLFPESLRVEDGLIAMAQGIVNGNAVTLALHQRDGELILTGTDGQELRPLVMA